MNKSAIITVNSYHRNHLAFEAETQLIEKLTFDLRQKKPVVTNKDLILSLILLIECENDVVQSDIYRNALEIVVHRTPDDF